MLAEEYILIAPFPNQLQSGAERINLKKEHNINCINFTQQQFGLKEHRISAQQKALAVTCKPIGDISLLGGQLKRPN